MLTNPDGDSCHVLYDADGQPIAYRGSGDLDARAREALLHLADAARRRFEAEDAANGGELSARQGAGRARIRERNARIFVGDGNPTGR